MLVNGMGGVGKTAICRELAHHATNPAHIVIWLNGQSGIENELQTIVAPKFNIDIKQADWLPQLIETLNQQPRPSLLLLDNLEKNDSNTAVLHQLKRLNWHLIATSREPLAEFDTTYNIDVLPVAQCVELFKRHYSMTVAKADLQTLDALIELAGQHTLTIELLAKTARDGMLDVQSLYQAVKATGFDLSLKAGVSVTADHSGVTQQQNRQMQLHEHLSKLFQLANLQQDEKDILRTLAVLPCQQYHCRDELMVWLGLDEPELLVSLSKKGWLQRVDMHFVMHPVIAHVVKVQIELNQAYLEEFASCFLHAIQPAASEHWIEKSNYIAQLVVLVEIFNDKASCTPYLIFNLACIYRAQGQYEKTLPLLQQQLKIIEKNLGPDHPDVAKILNNLAEQYRLLGEFKQALPLFKRALHIKESLFGDKSPEVAITLNNLAILYEELGEYAKALLLYERTIKILETTLGTEDPKVATALNNLAMLYNAQREHQKSFPLLQRALAIKEKNLGPKHPDVATTLNNLAHLHESMDEYEKALPLYLRTLVIVEQSLGTNHPRFKTTTVNLAQMIEKMGGIEKVQPLIDEWHANND
ncbi:MAG: tetratricopeptide repeat protein [Algicola sp.]|nr:tetratricopeptide repeat protein [Algicola sp.]